MKEDVCNSPLDDKMLDDFISRFNTGIIKELSPAEHMTIFNYLKELKMYRQIGLSKDLSVKSEERSYILELTLGDWSDDGHGKCEAYKIKSNYPANELRQAYKDSCKKTGVSFNHNEDYTGLGDNACRVWCEYKDSTMPDKAVKILESYGIDCESVDCIIDAADIIMQFIALSMPEDFVYGIVTEGFEPINGWWTPELNVQFGYGLFD